MVKRKRRRQQSSRSTSHPSKAHNVSRTSKQSVEKVEILSFTPCA